MFIKWLHHLFNPHCPDCAHDHECKSCETLREQLAHERFEKEQLLKALLPAKEQVAAPIEEEYKPVKPKYIPWNQRQQLLEAEDRAKARILRNQSTEDLEKELSINLPGEEDNASKEREAI